MTNSLVIYFQIILGFALLLISIWLIFGGLKLLGISGYWLDLSRFLSVLAPILIWYFTTQNSIQTNKRIDDVEESVEPSNIELKELENFINAINENPENAEFYFPKILRHKLPEKNIEDIVLALDKNYSTSNLSINNQNLFKFLIRDYPLKFGDDGKLRKVYNSYFSNLVLTSFRDGLYVNLLENSFKSYLMDRSKNNENSIIEILKLPSGEREPIETLFNRLDSNNEKLKLKELIENNIEIDGKPEKYKFPKKFNDKIKSLIQNM